MPARSRSATSCSSAAAPMPRWALTRISHLSPLVGIPAGIVVSVAIAAVIGVPTLRLSGHYFSMATIAVAELCRLIVTNTDYLGAAVGLERPDRAAQRVRSLLHLGAALLLSVPGDPQSHARHHLVDGQQPDGILSARHQGFRARGALARRARQPHQALRLHAERGADQRRRRALCDDVRLRRSGIRARHPDLGEDADHGGARRRRPVVRTAGRGGDPGAAGGNLQQSARRQGRGPHLRRLWRDHRADRAVPAGRHRDPDQAALGQARQGGGDTRSRREQAMLLEARDITKAFGSFKAVDARLGDAGAGRHPRPDRAERRRQIHLLQLPDRRPHVDLRQGALRRPRHHRSSAGSARASSASRAPSRCRRPSRACRCWRT